jgi:glyoxylase-like metal-dependent hydrolase (beta-lactamase superfamily II)
MTRIRNTRVATAAAGIAAGLVLLATVSPAAAQEDFSGVQIEATHVAGNVYMLTGQGGNMGVSVGPDGALLVDDQFAPLADKIRAALTELGQGSAETELRFVLNTHWHADHTGGNVEFGPEAPIIAHSNVRKRLSSPQQLFGRVIEPIDPAGLPVITFGESVSVHFNAEEIRAFHVPHGHTDGDAVIFFTGSNVVHMGDDFFSGSFPFVDLESGGSVRGLAHGIASVIKQLPEDVQLIPGHGPLSSLEDLREYHGMLVETSAIVQKRIDAGATRDEAIAEGLPTEWEKWGSGFINQERWLGIVYDSLTSEHEHEADHDHEAEHDHDG